MAKDVPDDPYAEIPVKDFSYTNNPNPTKQPKSDKKLKIIGGVVIAVIVIAAIAAVAFVTLHHKKNTPKTSAHIATTVSADPFNLTFSPSASYTSNNFYLDVNYPKAWTVNETTTSLTILSPETELTGGSGTLIKAKVLLSIFNQGGIPTAFGTNQSVAVLKSVKFAYTKPSQVQSAQTYISFIQYPATTVKGGLDAIYVTGNDGYTYSGVIPNSDINGISPLVVFSFLQCTNPACSTTSNLTIASTEWNNKNFSTLIEDIVKSFVFQ